jgi:hypothetical protein
MNAISLTLAAAGIALGGAAHASTITFETASSNAGPQLDPASYKAAVEQAMLQPGARSANVALFDNLSNQSVFGGSNANIAYRTTITFGVSAADAGAWGLRGGVDFGNGGAVFLDGVALAHRTNDMWWGGSYGNESQSFQFAALPMAAGKHTLQFFGLENCCDGGQQAQFSILGGRYTTFGAADGLTIAVPEPETLSLLLAGLAAIGFVARRRPSGRRAPA